MLPYVELAKLYEIDGKRVEAEEILRKALSIEPDNVAVMTELGYFLTKTSRTAEAVGILGAAVKRIHTPLHIIIMLTPLEKMDN